jgi:predicted enzyme related to lactoylglutathione lyase
MKFDKAIPILYSTDVSKSIAYFMEQLKFENKWEWDSPPTFGSAYRETVEIFFTKTDEPIPVIWLSIVVDNVDEYYESIKDTGAKILSPPDTKEWGMREMLVECPDGHMIRIGHNTACD